MERAAHVEYDKYARAKHTVFGQKQCIHDDRRGQPERFPEDRVPGGETFSENAFVFGHAHLIHPVAERIKIPVRLAVVPFVRRLGQQRIVIVLGQE